MTTIHEELGFYALPGPAASSRDLIDQVRDGEAMGLGHAFISERFNLKEACALSGAAAAVTDTIRIATAATNHNTRHPMVTAAFGTTMHSLSGGRFTLGIGRGFDRLFDGIGLPRNTNARMEDFVGLMRRLWQGEMILGHDGPSGTYPFLGLSDIEPVDIPLGFVAIGPKSLALGGKCFDQVVLHTFFTDETTERAVQTVKKAAEEAGRDPEAVKVWSCFATIGDHLPENLQVRKTVGRLATYLQGYGDLLVEVNGWDTAVLERFRADPVVGEVKGAIDGMATDEQLEHIATLIPDEWIAPSAMGSPAQCVAAVRNQLDLGCDGVILHGATPTELAPIVEEYGR